jgi:hypothetical protein
MGGGMVTGVVTMGVVTTVVVIAEIVAIGVVGGKVTGIIGAAVGVVGSMAAGLVVVGDDEQAARSSTASTILKIKTHFPECKQIFIFISLSR